MHTETVFCLLSLPRPSAAPADDTGADIFLNALILNINNKLWADTRRLVIINSLNLFGSENLILAIYVFLG